MLADAARSTSQNEAVHGAGRHEATGSAQALGESDSSVFTPSVASSDASSVAVPRRESLSHEEAIALTPPSEHSNNGFSHQYPQGPLGPQPSLPSSSASDSSGVAAASGHSIAAPVSPRRPAVDHNLAADDSSLTAGLNVAASPNKRAKRAAKRSAASDPNGDGVTLVVPRRGPPPSFAEFLASQQKDNVVSQMDPPVSAALPGHHPPAASDPEASPVVALASAATARSKKARKKAAHVAAAPAVAPEAATAPLPLPPTMAPSTYDQNPLMKDKRSSRVAPVTVLVSHTEAAVPQDAAESENVSKKKKKRKSKKPSNIASQVADKADLPAEGKRWNDVDAADALSRLARIRGASPVGYSEADSSRWWHGTSVIAGTHRFDGGMPYGCSALHYPLDAAPNRRSRSTVASQQHEGRAEGTSRSDDALPVRRSHDPYAAWTGCGLELAFSSDPFIQAGSATHSQHTAAAASAGTAYATGHYSHPAPGPPSMLGSGHLLSDRGATSSSGRSSTYAGAPLFEASQQLGRDSPLDSTFGSGLLRGGSSTGPFAGAYSTPLAGYPPHFVPEGRRLCEYTFGGEIPPGNGQPSYSATAQGEGVLSAMMPANEGVGASAAPSCVVVAATSHRDDNKDGASIYYVHFSAVQPPEGNDSVGATGPSSLLPSPLVADAPRLVGAKRRNNRRRPAARSGADPFASSAPDDDDGVASAMCQLVALPACAASAPSTLQQAVVDEGVEMPAYGDAHLQSQATFWSGGDYPQHQYGCEQLYAPAAPWYSVSEGDVDDAPVRRSVLSPFARPFVSQAAHTAQESSPPPPPPQPQPPVTETPMPVAAPKSYAAALKAKLQQQQPPPSRVEKEEEASRAESLTQRRPQTNAPPRSASHAGSSKGRLIDHSAVPKASDRSAVDRLRPPPPPYASVVPAALPSPASSRRATKRQLRLAKIVTMSGAEDTSAQADASADGASPLSPGCVVRRSDFARVMKLSSASSSSAPREGGESSPAALATDIPADGGSAAVTSWDDDGAPPAEKEAVALSTDTAVVSDVSREGTSSPPRPFQSGDRPANASKSRQTKVEPKAKSPKVVPSCHRPAHPPVAKAAASAPSKPMVPKARQEESFEDLLVQLATATETRHPGQGGKHRGGRVGKGGSGDAASTGEASGSPLSSHHMPVVEVEAVLRALQESVAVVPVRPAPATSGRRAAVPPSPVEAVVAHLSHAAANRRHPATRLASLQNALAAAQPSETTFPVLVAAVLIELSTAHLDAMDIERAKAMSDRALELATAGSCEYLQMHAHLNIGRCCETAVQPDKARESLMIAFKLAFERGDELVQARTMSVYATVMELLAYFDEAFELYARSRELAEKLRQRQLILEIDINQGIAHLSAGEVSDSLPYFERCLAPVLATRDGSLATRLLSNVAHGYMLLGDNARCKAAQIQEIDLCLAAGDKLSAAGALSMLGQAQRIAGEFRAALETHTREFQLVADMPFVLRTAEAFMYIGQAHRLLGQYRRARTFHERERELSRSAKAFIQEAKATMNLAFVDVSEAGGWALEPCHCVPVPPAGAVAAVASPQERKEMLNRAIDSFHMALHLIEELPSDDKMQYATKIGCCEVEWRSLDGIEAAYVALATLSRAEETAPRHVSDLISEAMRFGDHKHLPLLTHLLRRVYSPPASLATFVPPTYRTMDTLGNEYWKRRPTTPPNSSTSGEQTTFPPPLPSLNTGPAALRYAPGSVMDVDAVTAIREIGGIDCAVVFNFVWDEVLTFTVYVIHTRDGQMHSRQATLTRRALAVMTAQNSAYRRRMTQDESDTPLVPHALAQAAEAESCRMYPQKGSPLSRRVGSESEAPMPLLPTLTLFDELDILAESLLDPVVDLLPKPSEAAPPPVVCFVTDGYLANVPFHALRMPPHPTNGSSSSPGEEVARSAPCRRRVVLDDYVVATAPSLESLLLLSRRRQQTAELKRRLDAASPPDASLAPMAAWLTSSTDQSSWCHRLMHADGGMMNTDTLLVDLGKVRETSDLTDACFAALVPSRLPSPPSKLNYASVVRRRAGGIVALSDDDGLARSVATRSFDKLVIDTPTVLDMKEDYCGSLLLRPDAGPFDMVLRRRWPVVLSAETIFHRTIATEVHDTSHWSAPALGGQHDPPLTAAPSAPLPPGATPSPGSGGAPMSLPLSPETFLLISATIFSYRVVHEACVPLHRSYLGLRGCNRVVGRHWSAAADIPARREPLCAGSLVGELCASTIDARRLRSILLAARDRGVPFEDWAAWSVCGLP